MAAILNLHFEQEPIKCHRGSHDFWNQHTLKPLRTNFGAPFRKCTTRPKFVTYLLHYYVNDINKCVNDLIVSVLQLGLVFNCKTLFHGSDIQTPFINENLMEAIAIFLISSSIFPLIMRLTA